MNPPTELITDPPAPPAASAPQQRDRKEKSGWMGKILAAVGAVVSILYLANIGFGWAEFPPDNLPGAGNIDEFLFSLLLLFCLQKLGINLLPMLRSGGLRSNDPSRQ
jgi:hypothetical protein